MDLTLGNSQGLTSAPTHPPNVANLAVACNKVAGEHKSWCQGREIVHKGKAYISKDLKKNMICDLYLFLIQGFDKAETSSVRNDAKVRQKHIIF